jgi:hypothetical protein
VLKLSSKVSDVFPKVLKLSLEVSECKSRPAGIAPKCEALFDKHGQGLTLVHFPAQREHFLSHVVGCFASFSDKKRLRLSKDVDECEPLSTGTRRWPSSTPWMAARRQGLTLVHFSAQLERFVWDRGCA